MRLSSRQPLILKAIFLAWAASSFGCGGDDEPTSPTQGPRLEWDQQAESLQQAQSLSFRLYVDDVGRTLNGAACRVATGGAGYACAAPLPQLGPGRHVLQLASVLNGVESARSEPFIASGDAGQLTVAQESDGATSPVPSLACLTTAATECYAVRAVASGLSGVRALSPAPDGRLFFIEGNASIRVVADGSLIAEPALALKDERAQLTGLAVDAWSFPESRFVFVAWTEETRSDQLHLNVTRYREVANTLGEGATILTGIPIPRDIPPLLAVDRNGHVYVAVPGSIRDHHRPDRGSFCESHAMAAYLLKTGSASRPWHQDSPRQHRSSLIQARNLSGSADRILAVSTRSASYQLRRLSRSNHSS